MDDYGEGNEFFSWLEGKDKATAKWGRSESVLWFFPSPQSDKSLTIKWSWFMATIGSKGKVQRLNPSHPSLHKISRYSYGLSPLARSVPVLALKRAVSRVPINFTET